MGKMYLILFLSVSEISETPDANLRVVDAAAEMDTPDMNKLSTRQKLRNYFKKHGGFKKWMVTKLKWDGFRSNQFYQGRAQDPDIDIEMKKIKSAGKMAIAMSALSIGLNGVALGVSIHMAGKRKEEYDLAAAKWTVLVNQLKEVMEQFPLHERVMELRIEDVSGIVGYILERDGDKCSVTPQNVLAVTQSLKAKAVDAMQRGTRYIADFRSIRETVDILASLNMSSKVIYDKIMESESKRQYADEIRYHIERTGLPVGTWGEWEARGECEYSDCGIPWRRMNRTCATGDDCLGKSEGIDFGGCEAIMGFREEELEVCVNDTRREDSDIEDLDAAFSTVCERDRQTIPAYYKISNKATGWLLAVNESNWDEIVVERDNSKRVPSDDGELWGSFADNQLWRMKEITQDDGAPFKLVSRWHGRQVEVPLDENTTVDAWTITESGRIEGGGFHLTLLQDFCKASDEERIYQNISKRVIGRAISSNSTCQEWELTFVEALPATTTTTTAPFIRTKTRAEKVSLQI